jgi:Holliday junction resolvase RusA-like endonuclease
MTDPTSYTGPLWVPGHPLPKGSQRCVTRHVGGARSVLKADNPAAETWQAHAAEVLAWKGRGLRANPITEAVEMTVDFHLAKAKTTKFKNAPIGHGSGDLDKLTRCIGDAVTNSGMISDDSIITRIVAEKIYSPTGDEGVTVELRPYTPPADLPRGDMPVRVQCGRINTLVGTISNVEALPALLRQVADQIERTSQ